MARARSEGIPPLNDVRRQIFAATNDGQLKPYTDWIDFGQQLKHPESLVNFVAAYGTHPRSPARPPPQDAAPRPTGSSTARSCPAWTTSSVDDPPPRLDESADNVLPPADSADFMFGTGAWANAGGKTITGVDNIDLWVGGLAEHTNLFGGLLGSTFNYVFENQLTNLQNGDRLYYLARTPGMNLRAQLEGNSFAELVMRNTPAHTLKADPFATADCKFELGNLTSPATSPGSSGKLITGAGLRSGRPDLRVRRERAAAPDGRRHVALPHDQHRHALRHQRPGRLQRHARPVDRIWGGADNDTFWGGEGNDIIEGGDGADIALGGEGNDIITDLAGDDVPKGGPGNDAIDAGPGLDIIMAGDGQRLHQRWRQHQRALHAAPATTSPSAARASTPSSVTAATTGKRAATSPTSCIGDSSSFFFDDHNVPGHDILIGQGGDDDYDLEGGDDIGVAGPGVEKVAGAAGYDWEIGLGDPQAQDTDLAQVFVAGGVILPGVRDKFNEVEALSGGALNDTLRGDDVVPTAVGGGGFVGCDALDAAGVARITGLDQLVTAGDAHRRPGRSVASSPTRRRTSACSRATSGARATSCSAAPATTSSRAAAPTTSSTATGTSTCGSACGPTRPTRPARSASTDLMTGKAQSTGNFGAGTGPG